MKPVVAITGTSVEKSKGVKVFTTNRYPYIPMGALVMLSPREGKYGEWIEIVQLTSWDSPVLYKVYQGSTRGYWGHTALQEANLRGDNITIDELFMRINSIDVFHSVEMVKKYVSQVTEYSDLLLQEMLYLIKVLYMQGKLKSEKFEELMQHSDKVTKIFNLYMGTSYEGEKKVAEVHLQKFTLEFRRKLLCLT